MLERRLDRRRSGCGHPELYVRTAAPTIILRAVAVAVAPARVWRKESHERTLIEARRYRIVCRHLDRRLLTANALRVSGRAIRQLLDGQVRFLTPGQARRVEGLVSRRTADWLRASRRYEGTSSGELPAALIAPLIVWSFERYGQAGTGQMVGLPVRSLYRVLNSSSVSFQLADRVVSGIAGAGWWRESPERLGWYHGHDRGLGR